MVHLFNIFNSILQVLLFNTVDMALFWVAFALLNLLMPNMKVLIKKRILIVLVVAAFVNFVGHLSSDLWIHTTPLFSISNYLNHASYLSNVHPTLNYYLYSLLLGIYLAHLVWSLFIYVRRLIYVKSIDQFYAAEHDMFFNTCRTYIHRCAEELRLRKIPQFHFSKHIKSPLTFGWMKPIIIFPIAYANHLSIPETEAILLHELIHIKNNDYLLTLCLRTMELFLFHNPFVKLWIEDLHLVQEQICDAQVIKRYDRQLYLNALMIFATQSKPSLAREANYSLYNRIALILNKKPKREVWKTLSYSILVMTVLMIIFKPKSTFPALRFQAFTSLMDNVKYARSEPLAYSVARQEAPIAAKNKRIKFSSLPPHVQSTYARPAISYSLTPASHLSMSAPDKEKMIASILAKVQFIFEYDERFDYSKDFAFLSPEEFSALMHSLKTQHSRQLRTLLNEKIESMNWNNLIDKLDDKIYHIEHQILTKERSILDSIQLEQKRS